MTEGIALVFPGMGAAGFADIGRFLVLDRYARERTEEADGVLGGSLLAGFRAEGDQYGDFSQIAFLVCCLALADRAERELGVKPDFCAGPSLGQRPLAVYTGALGFADAVRMTIELARCEREYFASEPEELVTHCFVHVPDEPFHALLAELTERDEWIEVSGTLDRGGYLVSLRASLLDEVISSVRAAGGYSMRTMRPPVHARRFAPLRQKAEAEVVSRYEFADPRVPVVADQDGRLVGSAAGVRRMVLETFDQPIDWPAVVGTLTGRGVSTAYITGPDLLFHRLDCTTRNLRVVAVTPKTAWK
ncbi:ACP S-malonyltransferase [Lentzea albida]|uniref:[acyl-carrier-protein] S-malonyltransferase n=1 Tax=Lentzea albida TaxID=65499 RepID=A0A1H9X666_9PSEU|nr:ACP S-malonyltransferase [Lentzea albida]SES41676.1 [acyl-carrier-protein] S-malonyltransferase [Lentzea albida]